MTPPPPAGDGAKDTFDVSFPGTQTGVRQGLAQVLGELQPLDLAPGVVGHVELVLAEALNNIVEHALGRESEGAEIRVRGHQKADALRITIVDRGRAMPRGRAPAGGAPDVGVAISELPEGGFGWFMIHSLAHDVRYDRVGNENHLRLSLPLAP